MVKIEQVCVLLVLMFIIPASAQASVCASFYNPKQKPLALQYKEVVNELTEDRKQGATGQKIFDRYLQLIKKYPNEEITVDAINDLSHVIKSYTEASKFGEKKVYIEVEGAGPYGDHMSQSFHVSQILRLNKAEHESVKRKLKNKNAYDLAFMDVVLQRTSRMQEVGTLEVIEAVLAIFNHHVINKESVDIYESYDIKTPNHRDLNFEKEFKQGRERVAGKARLVLERVKKQLVFSRQKYEVGVSEKEGPLESLEFEMDAFLRAFFQREEFVESGFESMNELQSYLKNTFWSFEAVDINQKTKESFKGVIAPQPGEFIH